MIDRGELVTLDMVDEILRQNHGLGANNSLDQPTDKSFDQLLYPREHEDHGEIAVSSAPASVWLVLQPAQERSSERKALLR